MHQDCDQYARLLFQNEYDRIARQLRFDLGAVAAKESGTNTLISTQCFNKNHHLFTDAARQLSSKRLELDRQALTKFGLRLKEEAEWLKANQSSLLTDSFWKWVILDWYAKPMWGDRAKSAENALWTELDNIKHHAEREITALSLEPVQNQIQPALHQTTYNNYGGQQNIAIDNGTVNATSVNNNADIEQLATKLAELLKSSQLPAELKEEAVDLAETVAEQAKAGQPKKGIIKAFGDKIKLIKDTVTGTDATLHASQDLYNTANQLGELIRQSIS